MFILLCSDISELWIHSDCFIWSNLPLPSPIVIHNSPMLDLTLDVLNGALSSLCYHCNKFGATIACSSINCNKNKQLLHFPCAKDLGYTFMEQVYRVYCNDHSNEELLSQLILINAN